MNLWRVLWMDKAGYGRFSDVKAANAEHAAWIVRHEEDQAQALVRVMPLNKEEE